MGPRGTRSHAYPCGTPADPPPGKKGRGPESASQPGPMGRSSPEDRIAHRHHTISSNAEAAATATTRHRASRGPWGRRDGGSRSLSPTARGRQARERDVAFPRGERRTPPELLVGPGRLERPTSRLSGVRSNQLSYGPAPTPVAPVGPPRGRAGRASLRSGRDVRTARRAVVVDCDLSPGSRASLIGYPAPPREGRGAGGP